MVLDVDGVLTDGGLHYDAEGRISKRFHVQDGLGIKMGQKAGLAFAVITGLESSAVSHRVRELGIEHYFPGQVSKVPVLLNLIRMTGVALEEMAYVGDDWVDAAPMARVGLPMAVKDAVPEILDLAAWVSSRPGGHGAVREAVMFVLRAKGLYGQIWQGWRQDHGD